MYSKDIICFISDHRFTLSSHSAGQLEKLTHTLSLSLSEELTWQSEQLPHQDLKKTKTWKDKARPWPGVAQWGGHDPAERKVTSSIPGHMPGLRVRSPFRACARGN